MAIKVPPSSGRAVGGDAAFIAEVQRRLGQAANICYQCGKCTAGCPMACEMDLMPHRVVRLVQLGRRDHALRCATIWLCASCQTCSSRCPKDFDIARLMDVLREMSIEAGLAHRSASDIIRFHRSFLNSVRRHGRTFEPEMVLEYKLRSRHFLQDTLNAVRMAFLGKLRLLPRNVHGRKGIRQIFRASRPEAKP